MGKVYFGNETKQTWIKAPQSGLKANTNGWTKESVLLNGRAFVRRSNASHRRFDMSWLGDMNAAGLEDSLQTIKDFYDGVYGPGPFYWIDPYAADSNILPPHWANPSLSELNWPSIASNVAATYIPEAVGNNYPGKYMEFDTTNDYQSTEELTLIIPQDYTLNFGWHGPTGSASSAVTITPYLRSTGLADTAITPVRLNAGSTTKTNTKIKGDTYSYVKISIATTLASTVSITSMFAQILPENDTVAAGPFLSGRGTTGLEFVQSPQIEYYSANIGEGRIGMSTTLVEV